MSYQSYADIIIDISHESIDKTYQYAIPDEWMEKAVVGALVTVPFGNGNRTVRGYITGVSQEPKIEIRLIKPIAMVHTEAPMIESHLIGLADWMRENFGGTMNEALKTVIPVKKAVKIKENRSLNLAVDREKALELYEILQKKNHHARARLLEVLIREQKISYEKAVYQLKISRDAILGLEKQGILRIVSEQLFRNPISGHIPESSPVILNEEQHVIVNGIIGEYNKGIRSTYLIHGITGSGKTEVYMEIIASVIAEGQQVIMLIPEIALTYQMVQRFYGRFGDRVSIMNSKMSEGERYDQSNRAKMGLIDIMIGPRSALFTPFQNLGMVIIDEEHEGSYKSETTPKYHAVVTAIKRAGLIGASVVLGSATPSLESYDKALKGEYKLYELTKRAKDALTPKVWIADLREELKNKNRSIFSRKLRELIIDRLNKKEQIMLFINRRGYAGFVSCRSCGFVIKCPHCDISLTSHNNGKGICHYCGYEQAIPNNCPSCGSHYIAAFGTGTQKVEDLVAREFPGARVLRMDMDTTRNKGGHENILKAFAGHQADILVGTQMIVKGHDFPKVTLVGIIAADLSLYAGDFRAAERTFSLLCQAAGRAGRDALAGEVVIQTYNPEHYSVEAAAQGDYKSFFQQEILYRKLMQYPPAAHILVLLITSKEEECAVQASVLAGKISKEYTDRNSFGEEGSSPGIQIIGPAPAGISKINDIYRQVLYLKSADYSRLVAVKNYLADYARSSEGFARCNLQFDFNPLSGY